MQGKIHIIIWPQWSKIVARSAKYPNCGFSKHFLRQASFKDLSMFAVDLVFFTRPAKWETSHSVLSIGCIRKQWEISGKLHTRICQHQCHCECYLVQFFGLNHCSRGRSCVQFVNQLLPFGSNPHTKILVLDEKDNNGSKFSLTRTFSLPCWGSFDESEVQLNTSWWLWTVPPMYSLRVSMVEGGRPGENWGFCLGLFWPCIMVVSSSVQFGKLNHHLTIAYLGTATFKKGSHHLTSHRPYSHIQKRQIVYLSGYKTSNPIPPAAKKKNNQECS